MNWLIFVSLIIVAGATLLYGIEIQKINKYIDRRIGTPDDDSLSLQNKIVIKQNETIIKRIDDMTLWMKDLGSDDEAIIKRIDDMTLWMKDLGSDIDDMTELVKNLSCENATLKSENEKLQIENKMLKNKLLRYQNRGTK